MFRGWVRAGVAMSITMPQDGANATAPAQRSLNAPSILDAIRGAARSAHLRVEASLSMRRLISSDYTEREYVRHLCDLLGFYEPFEAALAAGNAGVKAPISPSRSR